MKEPKYKIGQKLFFLQDASVSEETVTAVAELSYDGQKKGYQYHFDKVPHADRFTDDGWLWEEYIFSTKQDLLNSL